MAEGAVTAATAYAVLAALLLAAAGLRINLISGLYLGLFLLLALRPPAAPAAASLATAVAAVAAAACLGHVVCQIALGAQHPYADAVPVGSRAFARWQALGFGRLDAHPWVQALRLVLPDVVVLVAALVARRLLRKQGAGRGARSPLASPSTHGTDVESLAAAQSSLDVGEDEEALLMAEPESASSPESSPLEASPTPSAVQRGALWLQRWWVGSIPLASMLFVCGAAVPSMVAIFYTGCLLALVLPWGFGARAAPLVTLLRTSVRPVAGVHLLALYTYQFRSVRKALGQNAQLAGLYTYVDYDPHSDEPWTLRLADLPWPYWTLLLGIVALYFVATADVRAKRYVLVFRRRRLRDMSEFTPLLTPLLSARDLGDVDAEAAGDEEEGGAAAAAPSGQPGQDGRGGRLTRVSPDTAGLLKMK